MTFKFSPGQHVHIVGIGGFGMSAIARVLLESGYRITGSDQQKSELAADLERAGSTIYIGHDAEHISRADVVLASSAIPDDNPELHAAQNHNIPVLRRREAIGSLTANYRTIAIAGTHGKTTTTALLSHVMKAAGLDPTVIAGGVIKSLGSNAYVGTSDFFVIEADEYGGMFLGLNPEIGVVTNLEYDHPDFFPTIDYLRIAFKRFVDHIDPDGLLVAGIDSPMTQRLVDGRNWLDLPVTTYAIHQEAAWRAHNIQKLSSGIQRLTVVCHDTLLGTTDIPLIGQHNVQNALAVIAVSDYLGISFESISAALATFEGTGRRSEIMGIINDITIVNDYAHHPTAIRMQLEAWSNSDGRLWAIWQPHTYNRLRALAAEFAAAFDHADYVLVTDVYSVREDYTPGLSASDMPAYIKHPHVRYTGSLEHTAEILLDEVRSGDTVVIMSAGDAPRIGHLVLEKMAI